MNTQQKELIKQAKIYPQVVQVLGEEEALHELSLVYTQLIQIGDKEEITLFSKEEELPDAFNWFITPQGYAFWKSVTLCINTGMPIAFATEEDT